jgi:hypothetical protein
MNHENERKSADANIAGKRDRRGNVDRRHDQAEQHKTN